MAALEAELAIPMEIPGGSLHVLQGFIDVAVGGVPPAGCAGVVFFTADIRPEQSYDLAEAAAPVEARIRAWMIVDILAIDDRSAVDLEDGFLHFLVGGMEVAGDSGLLSDVEVPLREVKIAARVHIPWMPARSIGESASRNERGRGRRENNHQ